MKKTYQGSCHCGKVRFEVDLNLDHVRSCDCSICRRRGALVHRLEEEDFRLLTPLEDLTLYQWHTKTAKDYFCPTCGILPFRRPRLAPHLWSVNVRCLEGVDLAAIPVEHLQGSRLDQRWARDAQPGDEPDHLQAGLRPLADGRLSLTLGSAVERQLMINRAVLIVRPKQPFLDWAAGLDDSGLLPNVEGEQTVYLIPEFETRDEEDSVIEQVYLEVFENELHGWHTDETAWPVNRDLATFREWFTIELHTVVEDLCGYEIVDDDDEDDDDVH